MWNNTDIPLALLITFRCYGTWLHGDERGSVNRFHNRYLSPFIPPNKNWNDYQSQNLNHNPVTLDTAQREAVETAIKETCQFRNWFLHAINVRTNHVHIVVSVGDKKAETVLNAFKANATRNMRQMQVWPESYSPWSDKGSTRYLWTERSLGRAVEYVLNGQGDVLPKDFED